MDTEVRSQSVERRNCRRQQVSPLAYLDLGPTNGGIVVNVSEGGMAVHTVVPLTRGRILPIRFQLPRTGKSIDVLGQIAWMAEGDKEAGIEFVNLPPESRSLIRSWLDEAVARESVGDFGRPAKKRGEVVELFPNRVRREPKERVEFSGISEKEFEELFASGKLTPNELPKKASTKITEAAPSPAGRSLNNWLWSSERKVGASAEAAPDGLAATQPETKAASVIPALSTQELEKIFPSEAVARAQPSEGRLDYAKPADEGASKGLLPGAGTDTLPARPDGKWLRAAALADRWRAPLADEARPASAAPAEPDVKRDPEAEKAPAKEAPRAALEAQPIIGEAKDAAAIVAPSVGVPAQDIAAKSAIETPARGRRAGETDVEATEDARPAELPTERIIVDARSALTPERHARRQWGLVTVCAIPVLVSIFLGVLSGRGVFHGTQAPPTQEKATQAPATTSAPSATSVTAPVTTGIREGTESRDVVSEPTPSATAREASNPASSTTVQQPNARRSAREEPAIGRISTTPSGPISPEKRLQNTNAAETTAPIPASTEALASPTVATPVTSVYRTKYQISGAVRPEPEPSSPEDASSNSGNAGSAAASASGADAGGNSTDGASSSQAGSVSAALGDRLIAPQLMYRVEPLYPEEAKKSGTGGTVRLRAVINREGRVEGLAVVDGPAVLVNAALEAAHQWQYLPAMLNGQAIESQTNIEIVFRAPR
jgi:TonB family protein